jgi:hypothetical protein
MVGSAEKPVPPCSHHEQNHEDFTFRRDDRVWKDTDSIRFARKVKVGEIDALTLKVRDPSI